MAGELTGWLRSRLSILWFLEWAISGTLMTYLPIYWDNIGVAKSDQGKLMALTAVGLWVAPFVVGQIVDRWMAAERYMLISHLLGGITLYWMAIAGDQYALTHDNLGTLRLLCGLFAVTYFPTVPLTTALCFRHLPEPEKQFSKVRVWGTGGWMLSGLALSVWLARDELLQRLADHFPDAGWRATLASLNSGLRHSSPSDCFRMSAVLSIVLSAFCLLLPHTPPLKTPKEGRSFAPLEVMSMLKQRSFAVFVLVSFLLAVLVVPMFNLAVPPFLGELIKHYGFSDDWVPTVMLVGQISEFPALLLLPLCLTRLGMKMTFILGLSAWAFRFGIFAIAGNLWSVMPGLIMHGVCHVFLVIVAQLYIDAQCPKDARVSAQNLLSFVSLGIGMPLGALLAGEIQERFMGPEYRLHLYSFPAISAILLILIFWKFVDAPAPTRSTEPAPNAPAEA